MLNVLNMQCTLNMLLTMNKFNVLSVLIVSIMLSMLIVPGVLEVQVDRGNNCVEYVRQ